MRFIKVLLQRKLFTYYVLGWNFFLYIKNNDNALKIGWKDSRKPCAFFITEEKYTILNCIIVYNDE